MILSDFVSKWQKSELKERAGAQSHFNDLCEVLGYPRPSDADHTGQTYTFEKGVTKTSGGEGFADVWMRGFFGWEYKGKHKDLNAAYQQLLTYREDLENPPLLVVSDMNRFEVHTNFTGTAKQIYRFVLADLLTNVPTPECKLPPLDVLRALFTEPTRLKPDRTAAEVTEIAAAEFATLAQSLRDRGNDPERSAHFLMRLLFCLFAEDIGLLPSKLFSRLVDRTRSRPANFSIRVASLFAAMATGGAFGADDIAYFNGDLFTGAEVLDLSPSDLETLLRVSELDWSSIEPAIFGTLFERSLDPDKRSQLGAHYTSREDILLIVEPVLMAPLRRRWASIKAEAEQAVAGAQSGKSGARKLQRALRTLLLGFVDELSHIRVLDPACGSGNFLYVALKQLLDLWKAVSVFGSIHGLPGMLPYQVGPSQLFGIEKNVYAHELASVVAWIGYIQWLHDNGFGVPPTPILKRLDNVRRMDSILSIDEEGRSYKPDWPDADVIIGNPPFLGGNKVRQELGDEYVERLFALYQGEVAPFADLVCYWFERTRSQIEANRCKRAGLLATQGIRGGANRRVLERIKQSGDIFCALSDRNWYLDGAMVHVSMLGFDGGEQNERTLDGLPVATINADLTSATDVTLASPLKENEKLCFMGPSAKGPFDIDGATASYMLGAPVNVNGRPNSDVVRKVFSGVDLVQRWRGMWTIDFALMSQTEAAQYERPFEYVRQYVLPIRSTNRRKAYAERWWLYAEPRPTLRRLVRGKSRIISTPAVAKHRIFVWVSQDILCNQGTLVFARDDDYFFGVLQSRIHEIWSRRSGTQVREAESGFRYTPTTTFETFPLPWPPGAEPQSEPRVESIAAATRDLVTKRDAWLNPPNAPAGDLAQRTLTRLYNQCPQWLLDAHNALDSAALAAYDWPSDLSDDDILARLLELNRHRRRMENEGMVSRGCQ